MENLNNFIRRNNLILNIKEKYKCKICSGVLVESMESRCLCRFCKKCVVEYLNGEDKQCPGCTKNNQEMLLNYARDVRENFSVETKLKLIKCKCVFNNCDEQIELQNMLEHVEKCVHSDILCTGEMKELSILRNVINEIKDKVEKIEREKNDLKRENIKIRNENEELKNKYVEINNKLDKFVKDKKEESETLKKENVEIRKENEELRNKYVEINNKLDNFVKDNEEMKKKMEENEERMKKTVESLNEEIKSSKEKNEILTKKFEKESIEKRINQYNYTFTNMSQIKGVECHYSPPFQLSNYEFRFAIIYYNDGEIFICTELLPSSNDSSNEWPIKKKFILEVIKNDIPVHRREFDYNSSRYKAQYEKVKSSCTDMNDSHIQTYDPNSIFENDNLNLKLSLN